MKVQSLSRTVYPVGCEDIRWLEPDELDAWLADVGGSTLLDAALDRPLQRDSGRPHASSDRAGSVAPRARTTGAAPSHSSPRPGSLRSPPRRPGTCARCAST